MPSSNFSDRFVPALPKPVTWSVKDNEFDDSDVNPKSLSLFVPVQSIQSLANHLIALGDDMNKRKKGKVWDYEAKEQVEVEGVYINAKGKSGDWGDFGNINPRMIEIPF
jgi:hypothetical protein